MSVKIILYIIAFSLSLLALDSINTENMFKKNKTHQAKILFFFLSISMSYLVVNFLYDIFISSNYI